VFTIRPILLVGPPGVGKTRFMREVSKILGLEFTDISCGGITAGWILSGSSVSWSEGRPGMVHIAMRDGLTANPIILLDEIDKLSGDSRFSGFGPLYQLLDRESSCNFRDEAVDLEMNCSYVSWVATANHVTAIPEAIISRFTVIEVEAPSANQMVNVIQSIYSDILHDNRDTWGSHFSPEVSQGMIEALDHQGPREIVKMILAAMGRAAKSRKEAVYVLEGSDFKDFKKPVRRIGF
jgi:ATP-dependent Lon protease